MFAARVALPARLNTRASRRGKWHPRSRRQELLAFGLRGILVLDLGNGISGLAKGNQHSLGEMDTFFVTFRDLVPRRAVARTGMINESGFDGVCYDDKAVFWHPGSPSCFPLSTARELGGCDRPCRANKFKLRHYLVFPLAISPLRSRSGCGTLALVDTYFGREGEITRGTR